jgi:hypothetical protein
MPPSSTETEQSNRFGVALCSLPVSGDGVEKKKKSEKNLLTG